jgi:hypothetical protein
MRLLLAITCGFFAAGCAPPPGRPVLPGDSTVSDRELVPVHPSGLDIVIVRTWNADSELFVGNAVAPVQEFLARLIAPPDGRPVRDIHFGVVSSKIDMAEVCNEQRRVPNDGTLLLPAMPGSGPSPDLGWPSSWKWPPTWPYLTSDLAASVNLPLLAASYVQYTWPNEGDCSVTQFLESGLRAIDGRNAGFVRSDSLLLVWILADAEDCSTATAGLWAPALWADQYVEPGFRCYEAPPGLLYPVAHYVKAFSEIHPTGRVLFAITARDGSPAWLPGPRKAATAVCNQQLVTPAPRLSLFAAGISALNKSNQEALELDPCAYVGSDQSGREAQMRTIADRVLEIMAR